MTVAGRKNPKVKVAYTMGSVQRAYEGDVVISAIVTMDEGGRTTVRTERIGNLKGVEDSVNLCSFLGAVELLHAVATSQGKSACVIGAKAALKAIDDIDPTKTCPFCGRKPRKDSDLAVWGADNVLIACERCVDKVKKND